MTMHWKFPFGRLVSVLVSHVDDSTGNVFLQINDEAGKLESLMAEIEQTIQEGSLKALRSEEITVGSVYLVQYQEDNVWYRARVLSYNARKQECEVFFFDYGNTDFVPVSCMRVAKETFCELPSQSFECELDGIHVFKGDRFREVVTTLSETILEQELFCKAVQFRKNCAVVVHLFVDEKGTDSVFEKIKARFATGTDSQTETNSLGISNIHSESILEREVKYDLISLAVDSFHDLIVTWVEDPSHFWCQLLSKAEAFAELMEDIAAEYANLGPEALPLRSCTVGYPCCAKFYEDESWNRGIITNVSSIAAGQIEIRFVDFGNSQKTELKDVRDLKNKFLKFPCQAIYFTIAGVDPNSKDGLWADEAKALFEKLIKDKHVVGLVVNVEGDGRHRVKLIDTTTDLDMELNQVLIAAGFGLKSVGVTSTNTLPIKSPNSCPKTAPPVFARESVQVGVEEKVLVTTIVNPSKFFCQLFRNGPKLENLMQDIGLYYSKLGTNEEILLSPSPGDPCCAQFSEDGCWYRAIVLGANSKGVAVQYIDYGNSETVPTINVKKLIPKFSDLPKQAIECTLNRIKPKFVTGELKWRMCDTEMFQRLALEKEGQMTVVSEDSSGVKRMELVVKNKKEAQNINEQLVISGNAVLADGALPASENWSNVITHTLPRADVKVGHFEDAVVSYMEHPGNFWCQLLKTTTELHSLMEEITIEYSKAVPRDSISNPSCGMLCCAQYTDDDAWYRGKITGIKKGGLVEVHFVDYGNYEILPLSRVKVLKANYMKLPVQAIHCELAKLQVTSEALLSDNVIIRFEELTCDKELVIMADRYDEERDTYQVVLLDTSEGKNLDIALELQSATEPLKSHEATCIPSLDLHPGITEHVFVSFVMSPRKFFFQLMKESDSLDELMGEMSEYYNTLADNENELAKPVVGEFCAAKFTVDDAWYRAQVLDVQGSHICVSYIDFGNTETLQLTRVKVLNPKFQNLPIQALECWFRNVPSSCTEAEFQEVVTEKEFNACIVSVKSGVAEVNLFSKESKESLHDILSRGGNNSGQHVPATCRITSVQWKIGDHVNVYIPFAESVQKFFCQATKHSDELNALMNRMEEHYSVKQELLSSIEAGSLCAAWYEGGGWYRAMVNHVQGESIDVFYIDYGDTATIGLSSLRTLEDDFSLLPAQAVQCCLAGFSTNPEPANFVEIAIEQEFEAQVVNAMNGVFEVDLVSRDGFLSQRLAKERNSEVTSTCNVSKILWNVGDKIQVVIPYVESAQMFFCQATQNMAELDDLMNRLEEHYSTEQDRTTSVSCGSFCVALYEEGGWYRARVNQVQDGTVEVFYIDYGDKATLPLNSIRAIEPEFSSLPAQAVQCCLKGFSVNGGPGNFKDLVVEQEFEAQVISVKDGVFEIELFSDVDSVSQMLAKEMEQSVTPICNVCNIQWSVGDRVQVFIPYAESVHKFFCQPSKQTTELEELMNRLEEHYSVSLANVTSVSCGSFCIALYEEGGWYRARVNQVQDGTVEVFYIDYGDTATLPLNSIRAIEPEFSSLPAQAVQCCLKGFSVNGGPANFKDLVIEQEFEAQVISVKNSTVYEVELVTKDSAFIREMLIEGKDPGVTYAEIAGIKEGTYVDLCPTACISPHVFYCQIMTAEHKENLEQLMNQLQVYYDTINKQERCISEPRIGMLCAAVFAGDGLWYRGKVSKVLDEETVEVFYLDYGNCETVELEKLKLLKQEWTSVTAQAVCCSMPLICPISGTQWPNVTIERFRNLTAQKQLVGKIMKFGKDCSLELDLFDTTKDSTDINIGELLVKEGLACYSGSKKPVCVVKNVADLGQSTFLIKERVFVTTVETPECFYCQISGNESKLTALMDQIAAAYDSLSDGELSFSCISPGDVCCAQFSEDNLWYRAALEEQTANALTVRFIDYGNTETLPVSKVKILKEDFLCIPPLAIRCSLHGVKPAGSQYWVDEASVMFEELTSGKSLQATFMSSSVPEPFEVQLLDCGTDIADQLVKAKLALSTATTKEAVQDYQRPLVECGQIYDVYITYIASAGTFYCQLVNLSEQLDGMMNGLNNHYFQLAETEGCVVSPTIGQPCVALFEEMWYRAKVLHVSVNDLTVHYVDYGNTETVKPSGVKQIMPTFLATPVIAVECSLDLGRESWSEEATSLLEKLTGNEIRTIKVVGQQKDRFEVKVFGDMAHCISDEVLQKLKETGEEQIIKEEETLKVQCVQAGQAEKLHVVHTENSEEFYVQLSKSYAELEKMMEEIAEVYSGLSDDVRPEDLVVGTPCCALFAHDNCWYRAVITCIASDFEVEVHYVDYGNTAVVLLSDIRKLSRRFFSLPVQAICCCLDFTPSNFDSDETSFQHQVDDKELLGQFLSLNGDKWKVRLFDHDKEIGRDATGLCDSTLEDKGSLSEIREYIQHAINLDVKHRVYVSHVVNPDEFYVQLESILDDLTVLSQEINQFYSTLDPTSHVLRKPCPGMLCCAKFSEDGAWYRGRVNCVGPSGLNVKFIDYGNDELVDVRDVKDIDKNFIHLPQQAILCGLDASKELWTTEELAIFKSIALDKSFDTKFIIRDGQRWRISLGSDTGSVVDVFMTKDATLFQQAGSGRFPPALVTPGQVEEVYMSHVTEFGEFYVQLSKTALDLHMLEDLLCKLYEGETSGLAVEVCVVGSLCCAKFTEDCKWYRALVTNVPSDSQVEVLFVDYGNSEIVTVESIKHLKPELLKYPVQAIKCRLEGSKHVWTAADVEEFKAFVLDKPLHVMFTRHEDPSWFVTIKELDMFQAAPNNVTKAFANEAMQLNICEKAYFLSADSPECIWLQLTKTEAALSQVMDQIASEVKEEGMVKSQVVKGLACIGCFTEDDQWYRAQVLDVNSSVEVMYVDYGNAEWLPLDRLRSISDSAMLLPSQAIRCKLSGVQGIEPLKVTRYLNDNLSDKVVEAKAQSQCDDGSFTVVLYLPGDSQSVNEQILGDCLGDTSPSQEAELEQSITAEQTRTFKLPDLHQGSKVCVKFVSAFLPTKMKLLLTEKMEEQDEITRNITSFYSSKDEDALQLKDPEVGQVCCVPFCPEGRECEEWFRGELLSISADGKATTLLVDFGICEQIPLSKLRVLADELLVTPVQVVECSLSGICPSSEDRQWSPECSSVISSICAFKALTAEIVQTSEDAVEVILYDEDGKSVNDCLVDLGLAAKVLESSDDFLGQVQSLIWPQLEAGSHHNVYFMQASDLERVQLQFADSEAELSELMKQISIVYTSLGNEELALTSPCVGQTCCAQYSEDRRWYRAVITAVSNEGVQVKFVDYGNTDLAVAVKQLKGEFLSLPVQCMDCCLKHVVPAPETRKEDIALKFYELCESKVLTAEVAKVSGDFVEINLFYDIAGAKHSVSEALMNLGLLMHSPLMLQQLRQVSISDGKMVYNNPKLEFGCCYKVTVLCAESPSDFWCYLAETGTEVESLSKKIALFYNSLGDNDMRVSCLQVGDVCCAQFSENGQWYRSQVTKLCSDTQVHLVSVDYAKQETLPLGRIKKLDAEFAVVPIQAFHCTLHNVEQPHKYYGEGWSKEAIARFQELSTEFLIAEIVGVQGNLMLVELFNSDKETISGKLLSEGLAVEVKPVLGSLPAKAIVHQLSDESSANKVEHFDVETTANELVEDSVGKILLQDQGRPQALKGKEQVESEAMEKNDLEDDDEEFHDSNDQICTESLDCSGKQATMEVVTSGKPQEKENTMLEEHTIANKALVCETEVQREERNEIEVKAEQGSPEVQEETEASKTVTGGLSERKMKDIPSDEGIVCCDDTSAPQEVKIVEESLDFVNELNAGDKMFVEKEVQLSEEILELVEGKIKEIEISETKEESGAYVEEMKEQAQVLECKEVSENITSLVEEKKREQEEVDEEVKDKMSLETNVGAKWEESVETRTEEKVNGIENLETGTEQEANGIESLENGTEESEAVECLENGIEEVEAVESLESGTQQEAEWMRSPGTGIEEVEGIVSVETGIGKEVEEVKTLETGTEKEVEEVLSLETGIEDIEVIESLDIKVEDSKVNRSLKSEVQEEAKERSIERERGCTGVNTEEKEFQAREFEEDKEQVAEGVSEDDLTAIIETSDGTEEEEQCDKGRLCKDNKKIDQISNHEASARTFLDEVLNGVCKVLDKC